MFCFSKLWDYHISQSNVTIRYYFVVGHTSRSFSASTFLEDFIIRLNLEDSYLNLTLKSIAMLRWIRLHCNNARFIAKMDDDFLVSVDTLLDVLSQAHKQHMTNTIFGRVSLSHKWNIWGDAGRIWNLDSSVYPLDSWPNYASGPLYILTKDVIGRLLQRAGMLDTPLINIEDIFVTGIVRVLENVTLTSVPMHGTCSIYSLSRASTAVGVHHYDYISRRCMEQHRVYT